MADSSSSAKFSVPSIIAVIAAVWSFTSGAFFGLILAVAAILFGILGIVLSLAPRKRGGVISVFGVVAGGFGIVAAVIKAILWILA
ncbi:hypothetical protein [Luteolibacter marinus]|uniref:hypothetical protein n=1 Tax=Luteolibacter marinus TaxID=2776705 RepID=UPI0018681D01|nr:hypothetical protein [Luteolibacter marinus]